MTESRIPIRIDRLDPSHISFGGATRLLLTTSKLPRLSFIHSIGATLAVALLSGFVADDWRRHTLSRFVERKSK
jgi:hypothetical protein